MGGRVIFQRFTDRARRVVVLASEEARLLNHNYIGTEHILLGLLHEGRGVAAKALSSLAIELEQVRQEMERVIGRGDSPPGKHIPFTPRSKKVLELSLREALALGHNHIGTEHILLALVTEGEGVAAQVLVKLGPGLDQVRHQVIQLLARDGGSDLPVGEGADAAYAALARGSWAEGTVSGEAAPPSPPLCAMCGASLTEHLQVALIAARDEDEAGGKDAPEVSVPFCGRCGHAV